MFEEVIIFLQTKKYLANFEHSTPSLAPSISFSAYNCCVCTRYGSTFFGSFVFREFFSFVFHSVGCVFRCVFLDVVPLRLSSQIRFHAVGFYEFVCVCRALEHIRFSIVLLSIGKFCYFQVYQTSLLFGFGLANSTYFDYDLGLNKKSVVQLLQNTRKSNKLNRMSQRIESSLTLAEFSYAYFIAYCTSTLFKLKTDRADESYFRSNRFNWLYFMSDLFFYLSIFREKHSRSHSACYFHPSNFGWVFTSFHSNFSICITNFFLPISLPLSLSPSHCSLSLAPSLSFSFSPSPLWFSLPLFLCLTLSSPPFPLFVFLSDSMQPLYYNRSTR